jgi:hypothetical protein
VANNANELRALHSARFCRATAASRKTLRSRMAGNPDLSLGRDKRRAPAREAT